MKRYIKADYDATLPSNMLFAPDGDENMLKNYYKGKVEEDKAAKAEAEKQQKAEELKAKYPVSAITDCVESEDPLHSLFKLTVPDNGTCDSVGGEIVRAMMKILFRDWNDGDKFFEGYGRETCLPAAAFIIEKLPFTFDIFADIAATRDDDQYTREIQQCSNAVVNALTSDDISLFWTPNDEDMNDTDTSPYDDWEPTDYTYDGDFPDALIEAMFDDKVSRAQVEMSVQDALSWEDIQYDYLTVGEYGWSVEGLNRDTYERLQDMGNNIGSYVEDDLEVASLYEEDEEEDGDDIWSATQINSAKQTTQHIEVTDEWDQLFWNDVNFREWSLRRDEDYSKGYDFIDEDTEVYCQAKVTDIRYNPRYDFLVLDVTFTTGRFEDGKYIEEVAGIDQHRFPITNRVKKLLEE